MIRALTILACVLAAAVVVRPEWPIVFAAALVVVLVGLFVAKEAWREHEARGVAEAKEAFVRLSDALDALTAKHAALAEAFKPVSEIATTLQTRANAAGGGKQYAALR